MIGFWQGPGHARVVYFVHMKQLLIEIDEEMAKQLEREAPSRSRRRSEFSRNAIRQALWDLDERATAQAYARQPDSGEPISTPPLGGRAAVTI